MRRMDDAWNYHNPCLDYVQMSKIGDRNLRAYIRSISEMIETHGAS
jgi:hypothetical protein